jgi:hypothetical protein
MIAANDILGEVFTDVIAAGWQAQSDRIMGIARYLDSDLFRAGVTPRNEDYEIFVDGVRLPQCIKAHRGQGWATTWIMDGIRVLRDGLGRPKETTVYGVVEFRPSNRIGYNELARVR